MTVSAIADSVYKQQRLEMMAWEDSCKEKAEACCDAQEFERMESFVNGATGCTC